MAATFTNAYNRMAAAIAVKLAKGLPILANTRQQASDKVFENADSANGETMMYTLPDWGTPGTGGTISEAQMTYTAGSVPLTLTEHNIPFSAGNTSDTTISGSVREANEIEDFREQVEIPLAANLASKIQKAAAETAMLGAGGAVVIGSGTTVAEGLANACSTIQATYAGGELSGAMGPLMRGKFATGAANLFNPVDDISKLWRESAVGRYARAVWYETPDVDSMVTGTCDLTAAGITVTSYTAATNTLVIGATSLTGTITKGTVLNIGGIEQVDVFGRATGVPFAFVVQADATCSSNAATLTVQPVYTASGNAALCNVSAVPAASMAVESPLSPSTRYLRAMVWDRAGLGTGFGRMAPIENAVNFKFELPEKGLFFYGVRAGDVFHRRNIWRLDMLTGTVVTRSNWNCTVFVAA